MQSQSSDDCELSLGSFISALTHRNSLGLFGQWRYYQVVCGSYGWMGAMFGVMCKLRSAVTVGICLQNDENWDWQPAVSPQMQIIGLVA